MLTFAERGIEATGLASRSLGGMTIRERLFRLVRRVLPAPEAVTVFGTDRLYQPAGAAWEPSYVHGVYEPGTTALFRELLRPGMIVVDVGAHIGYFTLLAARLVGPQGRVYAFEPVPENYALLAKNCETNGYHQVQCIPQAVSNRSGQAPIAIGRYSLVHSLSASPASDGDQSVIVPTITLDEYFAREGWPAVDLVKMDIEGWEWQAFDGMSELLHRSPQLRLIIEYTPGLIRRAGRDPEAFLRRLTDAGLHVQLIDDRRGLLPLSAETLASQRGSNLLCHRE